VVFYFEPARKSSESDLEALMRLVEQSPSVTIKDIMHYLNVSRNTATRKLNRLIEQKQIIRSGQGPATKYVLKK